jgi:hypothetical protein
MNRDEYLNAINEILDQAKQLGFDSYDLRMDFTAALLQHKKYCDGLGESTDIEALLRDYFLVDAMFQTIKSYKDQCLIVEIKQRANDYKMLGENLELFWSAL